MTNKKCVEFFITFRLKWIIFINFVLNFGENDKEYYGNFAKLIWNKYKFSELILSSSWIL